MEISYIGAYWGRRPESALAVAERMRGCLLELGDIDSSLSAWFVKGSRRANAATPVAADTESLVMLIEKGRNRRDSDGGAIQALGFSIGLWNRSKPEVGLSGLMGASPAGPGILNNFILTFPSPQDGEGASLYRLEKARAIMDAVVGAWEPDWATWTTSSLKVAQSPAPREPVVGWLTYFREQIGAPSSAATVEDLRGGKLVVATADYELVDVPMVLDIRRGLAASRVIRPIP